MKYEGYLIWSQQFFEVILRTKSANVGFLGEGANIIAIKDTVLVGFAIDAPVENKPS